MGVSKKELYELLVKAWGEQPNDYHAYRLIDVVREAAGIDPLKGEWWRTCTGDERNKINELINYFVDIMEPPGPEYDDYGKTHCRLCDGWNGLHHGCPAANMPHETDSYEECKLNIMKLISGENE